MDIHQIKENFISSVIKADTLDNIESISVQYFNSKHAYKLYFPMGPLSVIDFLEQKEDEHMLEKSKLYDISKEETDIWSSHSKLHGKIYCALLHKLTYLSAEMALAKYGRLFNPIYLSYGHLMKFGWRTSDLIWSEIINDNSVDYNMYTKRSILMLIYLTTASFYFKELKANGLACDLEKTKSFLRSAILSTKNISYLKKQLAKIQHLPLIRFLLLNVKL